MSDKLHIEFNAKAVGVIRDEVSIVRLEESDFRFCSYECNKKNVLQIMKNIVAIHCNRNTGNQFFAGNRYRVTIEELSEDDE